MNSIPNSLITRHEKTFLNVTFSEDRHIIRRLLPLSLSFSCLIASLCLVVKLFVSCLLRLKKKGKKIPDHKTIEKERSREEAIRREERDEDQRSKRRTKRGGQVPNAERRKEESRKREGMREYLRSMKREAKRRLVREEQKETSERRSRR